MRILYVITRSDVIGGASIHLLDLAKGMLERGHSVLILVGGNGEFHSYANELGIQTKVINNLVRPVSLFLDLKAIFEIRHEIKVFKPDLVHLHSSKAGIVGRFACLRLIEKCFFTAHGWAFTDGVPFLKRNFYLFLEKYTSRMLYKVITVSDYDKCLALDFNVVDADKLITIPNGVRDMSNDKVEVSNDIISSDKFRFIMVARFDVPKQQRKLIHAFSKIDHTDCELVFVGDGPNLFECEQLSSDLKLSNKIIFLGNRSDVGYHLSSSDVFVLISDWEGLPLTILEAMSVGLPIIASDVGGVSQAVINNETGILVNDEESISIALSLLVKNRYLALSLSKAARFNYEKFFTLNNMIDKIEVLYNGK